MCWRSHQACLEEDGSLPDADVLTGDLPDCKPAFRVEIGSFSIVKVEQENVVHQCTVGVPCLLDIAGIGFVDTNKVLLRPYGSSCDGPHGSNPPVAIGNSTVFNANPGSTAQLDLERSYNLGTAYLREAVPLYLVCWSHAPTGYEQWTPEYWRQFYLPAGVLTFEGPDPKTFTCTLGILCSLTITGTGLSQMNGIRLIDGLGSCVNPATGGLQHDVWNEQTDEWESQYMSVLTPNMNGLEKILPPDDGDVHTFSKVRQYFGSAGVPPTWAQLEEYLELHYTDGATTIVEIQQAGGVPIETIEYNDEARAYQTSELIRNNAINNEDAIAFKVSGSVKWINKEGVVVRTTDDLAESDDGQRRLGEDMSDEEEVLKPGVQPDGKTVILQDGSVSKHPYEPSPEVKLTDIPEYLYTKRFTSIYSLGTATEDATTSSATEDATTSTRKYSMCWGGAG